MAVKSKTPDPVKVRDLADLAAAATECDRDLDAEIWWATQDHSATDRMYRKVARDEGVIAAVDRIWPDWRDARRPSAASPIPWLTTSLDAVRALHERLLPDSPGYELISFQPPLRGAQAEVDGAMRDGVTDTGAYLAALLSAYSNFLSSPED